MNCNQCGAEAPAGAAFCSQCGARLGGGNRPTAEGAQRLLGARSAGGGNQPAEQEVWAGSYSPKAVAGHAIGALLLTIVGIIAVAMTGGTPLAWLALIAGAIIAWGALGLLVLYRRLTVSYRLTTLRLFHETGLLNRTRDRIEVIDIDDVTLAQGLIERMLNVGTIRILSSDESLKNDKHPNLDGRLEMPGIEDARRVADLIDNTRRAERNRRGVFLENV